MMTELYLAQFGSLITASADAVRQATYQAGCRPARLPEQASSHLERFVWTQDLNLPTLGSIYR